MPKIPSKLLPPAPAPIDWTFLSNHTHVLVCLYLNPSLRLREIAQIVQITERSVQNILVDLEDAGVVSHRKEGRCNVYSIHLDKPLRHPLEAERTIGELLVSITGRKHGNAVILTLLFTLQLIFALCPAPSRSPSSWAARTSSQRTSRPLTCWANFQARSQGEAFCPRMSLMPLTPYEASSFMCVPTASRSLFQQQTMSPVWRA